MIPRIQSTPKSHIDEMLLFLPWFLLGQSRYQSCPNKEPSPYALPPFYTTQSSLTDTKCHLHSHMLFASAVFVSLEETLGIPCPQDDECAFRSPPIT